MDFYLPTREECQEIVKKSDAFYCTSTEVEGYQVEMYDYRLTSYSDFKDNNAFELRGLTFVYNPNTNEWERNVLLTKFFNVNQTIGWMYEDVKDKKIVRIDDKLDGSIISFVQFPNGVIRAKSKMSFTSDQAKMAQEIFETDQNIRVFVKNSLIKGEVPIFELVSPENQIVLEYNKTELVLLQIRSLNGDYFNETYLKSMSLDYMIPKADSYPLLSLDTLLKMKEEETDIEGWIVKFEDGQMAKIKTDWYLRLHGLIGPDAFRENLLIETILNGQIDDVLGNLVEGVKKDKIKEIEEIVNHKFNNLVIEYIKLRGEYFNKFNEDRKKFAMKYKQHEVFSLVMRNLNTSFTVVEQIAEKSIKEFILNKTKRLKDAKEWLI